MTTARTFDPARVARVTSALAMTPDDSRSSLCIASASVTRVSSAGVVLIMHGRSLGTVCSSDPVAETVEEMQYTFGEGPCVDAFSSRQPVLIPDLAAVEVVRWPGFRDGALGAGIRAAFGFLYHDRPGELSDEQLADAAVVAHVAGRTVLDWQSVAGIGSLAQQLEHLPANRAVVHQASGMISVQALISVDDAVALLRAYAFSTNRPVTDVASDVVRGDIRFGAGPQPA
jgi:hypothetical protein